MKNQLFNILEELFQQANEKIIVFNRLGEIEFVNKRASEALQLSNIDSHFFKLTEKSSTEWKEFINSVVQNITASYTLSVVNDNNQEVTLKILGYYIEEKQLIFGRVRLNPINTFSIAGNKNAKTFQQLINGMAHGVVLTSMDGKIISANSMALQLLNREPNQIENRSYDCLFEDCIYDSSFINHYYKQISNKEVATLFVKKIDENQKITYLNFISRIDDNLGLLVTTIMDQTEKISLVEKIEHQQSLSFVGQNVALIAHELRNPMTSIQGFIQMIKSNSNEEEHPYFQIIETELQRIDDLLLDLLNISKPKTDELCMVDLKQLVEKTIELMQPKAIISNAMIVFDYEETLSYSIYGSYNRLKQMLINLLKNAIESIETSNFIFVSLHYKNDSIQLSIKDRGKGMDTTTLETIFNPFYTTKETGTGLGLILVQSVVAEHNGTIQIESEQGVGTTFLIDFKVMPNDIQKRSQIQYSNELYSKLS